MLNLALSLWTQVLELTPEEAAEMRNNWAALMDAGRAEQREKDQERVVQEAAQEYLAAGPMRSLGTSKLMSMFCAEVDPFLT
jgi:hypothetical protein